MNENKKARYECGSLTLDELLSLDIKQPRFAGKRGYAWDPFQKREFLRNCMEGHYPGTVMLVRDDEREDGYYLLDFTQRYLALKEYDAGVEQGFKNEAEVSSMLTVYFARAFPNADISEIMRASEKAIGEYGKMPVGKLLLSAVKEIRRRIDDEPLDVKEFEDILESYMPEREELGSMEISAVTFDSMDDAVFNYIQMNTNQHNLHDVDIWRARWNNCDIDISGCSQRQRIVDALDRYYRDIAKKTEDQRSGRGPRRWNRALTERMPDEKLLEERKFDPNEAVRNFEYDSTSISEDSDGHLYISLYELCCALAYIFYERSPQFAISEDTLIYKHEWKSAYLGFIFLGDIFRVNHRLSSGVEELSNYSSLLNDNAFLDEAIDSMETEFEAFTEAYKASVFSDSAIPPTPVFTSFIDMAFLYLWHARYELLQKDGVTSIKERGDSYTYERVKRALPAILFKMLLSSNTLHALIRKPYAKAMEPLDFDSVFADIARWDDIGETMERLPRTWNGEFVGRYEYKIYKVLYSMFTSMFLDEKLRDRFELSSIFDQAMVDKAMSEGRRRGLDNIDFGNMFYMPKIEGIKGTIGLRAQEEVLDEAGLGKALGPHVLEELHYPEDGSFANKKETFDYIRRNLLKDRPRGYKSFVNKRQDEILQDLSEHMHAVALSCLPSTAEEEATEEVSVVAELIKEFSLDLCVPSST